MFKTKYKKSIELLDNEISFAFKMHQNMLDAMELDSKDWTIEDEQLHANGGGWWKKVDYYQAQLDALCRLRRKLKREIGS